MNYIFDFDGTIVDSLPAMISVYNKVIRDNKDPLQPEEIEVLRGMTSRRALKHMGVRWWQVPKLFLSGMGDFHALIPAMKPCVGIPEVLQKLHARGDKLFIVTSNTHDNVVLFLDKHNLTGYFTDIKTGSSLFKKSKDIRKLIKEYKLKRRQTVYVGDETRDVQAARLALIKIVSVSWGFNTRKVLAKQRPNYLIDDAKELFAIKLDTKK